MSETSEAPRATHNQDGVRHTLEIVVPAASMDARVEAAARAFRGRVKLAGFRKGKAPLSMVRQQFGDDIRQRVLDHAIPEIVAEQLSSLELRPLDSPELADVEFRPGEPLSFTVRFDTAPEVTVSTTELRATRRQPEVSEELVDEALGDLRERGARLLPVDDGSAAEGMYARCEIALLSTDTKGKKLAEEDRYVHLGAETAIPGLNAQLEGLTVGDERAFVTTLAEEFPNALLAGKEVRCRVRVTELKRRELPELDDELARDLGFDDLAGLRERAREDIGRRLEVEAERDVEGQLLEQLRRDNPVDVPESLVERRLDEMTRRFATDIANQGVDPREALDWAAWRRDSRPRATDGLAEEMLLDKIAADEGLEVDDEAVTAEIREQHARSEGGKSRPLPSLIQQMRKDGSYEGLRLALLRRRALEHLKARATIDFDGGENAAVSGVSE